MFLSLNSFLRRRRRALATALAVLAILGAATVAHAAMASMEDHGMQPVAACVVVGGCLAVTGVAAFVLAVVGTRPWTRLPNLTAPSTPVFGPRDVVSVRAGPAAAALQVFRL